MPTPSMIRLVRDRLIVLQYWIAAVLLTTCSVVPFKNDAVKNAVLREHAKQEAVKLGVPIEVISAAQRQQAQQEVAADPFTPPTSVQAIPPPLPPSPNNHRHAEEKVEEEQEPLSQDGSKCALM